MISFWRRWLQGASLLTLLAGVALGSGLLSSGTVDGLFLAPFFGPGPVPPGALALWRFTSGVLGGVMAALGVLALALARGPIARGEGWASGALGAAIGVWFLVDTTASARASVWANVTVNVAFAALFFLPLGAAWLARRRSQAEPRPRELSGSSSPPAAR